MSYVKYDENKRIIEFAPKNKGAVSNYNNASNHDMLIADGYSYEEIEYDYKGVPYLVGHAPKQPLEEVKSQKMTETKNFHDLIVDNILIDYSQAEIASFYKQETEAKVYVEYKKTVPEPTEEQKNTTAPYMYATALARGIDFELLIDKVLLASKSLEPIQGALMGAKQRVEDMKKASTTIEEVNTIDVVVIFNLVLNSVGYQVDEKGIITPL